MKFQKFKMAVSLIWNAAMGAISFVWLPFIYMLFSGNSKGTGTERGSEIDIDIFIGVILLIIGVTVFCMTLFKSIKYFHKISKKLWWVPVLVFLAGGICTILFIGIEEYFCA